MRRSTFASGSPSARSAIQPMPSANIAMAMSPLRRSERSDARTGPKSGPAEVLTRGIMPPFSASRRILGRLVRARAVLHVRRMRLSLQVQCAICSVFDLAYNGHGEPVQVRVVSERQGIPARYLEQIFRRLRRAELVLSKRGPGGGYTLARPPSRIT